MNKPKELVNRIKTLEARLSTAVDKQLLLLGRLIEAEEQITQLTQQLLEKELDHDISNT